jgi:hypothetical protein
MDPAEVNITWFKNVDFERVFKFTDQNGDTFDWSADSFDMDIKTARGSGAAALTATIDDTDADESTIVVSWADGALAVGTYYYDLIRIDAGGIRHLMMFGTITILEGVTQP